VLPGANYAENGTRLAQHDLPVFVTLLLATLPEGEARANQAAGKGRVAFGGILVE